MSINLNALVLDDRPDDWGNPDGAPGKIIKFGFKNCVRWYTAFYIKNYLIHTARVNRAIKIGEKSVGITPTSLNIIKRPYTWLYFDWSGHPAVVTFSIPSQLHIPSFSRITRRLGKPKIIPVNKYASSIKSTKLTIVVASITTWI